MVFYDAILAAIAIGGAAVNLLGLHLAHRGMADAALRLATERGRLFAASVTGLQSIETLKATGTENDFFARWKQGETTTDLFGAAVKLGGPIAFCYLDGDHTYKQVRRDFENADAHLEPRGFLLFDDSADDCTHTGSRAVAREAAASGKYNVIAKNPHWFLQKRA